MADPADRANVFVAASQLANPTALVATLAHEVGHEILLGGGVLSEEVADHEQVTDLLTVFLGLGVFNANSTLHESHWNYGANHSAWSIGRQGYLSAAAFGCAFGVFAYVRGEAAPSWARHLRPDARGSLRKGLRYLRKTGDGLFRPDDPTEPRPPATAAELAEGLAHRSPTFRLAALWELRWSGAGGPDLFPAVCRCLGDPDPEVRAEAARAVAAFGRDAAVAIPRLLEIVLAEADAWPCALPTLVVLGADPDQLAPEVARLLPRHPAHVGMLAGVLRWCGDAAGPAVPALLDAFGRELLSGNLREVLAAVRALVPDPEAAVREHFAADAELLRHALWELRQPVE